MSSSLFKTARGGVIVSVITLFALSASFAHAQDAQTKNPVQKSGKYAVELRVPPEGLYAGEETDVELRITDSSQDDPVQGAPPIVNAKLAADVSMPAMPGMPSQNPKTHSEGVPGDYGVALFFPHGGDYRVALTVTPPGDKQFTVAFKVAVNDAQPTNKRKPKLQPYTLEVTTNPVQPRAGEPTELTVIVRSRDTKQPVTEFEMVHERLMHLVVVSQDLSHFAHEHPEMISGGKLTLSYTFPTGGEYRIFADTAPRGAGSQILMQPVKILGPVPAGSAPLNPAKSPTATVDGMKIAMKFLAGAPTAGRTVPITFTITDEGSGAPVTDIQPWLGAAGHLILIHQDGTTFVHCHPDEADPKNGQGQITFLARFPKAGNYRGWVQFQRGGKVETAEFDVAAGAVQRILGSNLSGKK